MQTGTLKNCYPGSQGGNLPCPVLQSIGPGVQCGRHWAGVRAGGKQQGCARSLNATVTWMDLSSQLSVWPQQPPIPDFLSHLRLKVVREALGCMLWSFCRDWLGSLGWGLRDLSFTLQPALPCWLYPGTPGALITGQPIAQHYLKTDACQRSHHLQQSFLPDAGQCSYSNKNPSWT